MGEICAKCRVCHPYIIKLPLLVRHLVDLENHREYEVEKELGDYPAFCWSHNRGVKSFMGVSNFPLPPSKTLEEGEVLVLHYNRYHADVLYLNDPYTAIILPVSAMSPLKKLLPKEVAEYVCKCY